MRQYHDLLRLVLEHGNERSDRTGTGTLSIQLHRWQLRLQTLNERKRELEEELRKTS